MIPYSSIIKSWGSKLPNSLKIKKMAKGEWKLSACDTEDYSMHICIEDEWIS